MVCDLANPIYRLMDRIYSHFDKKPDLEWIIAIAIIGIFLSLGVYMRVLPAINNGLEFHANDDFIEYWQANYTYHHGLLSWYTLTQDNPDTHLFWYPWGRDFTITSYPGLPIWTAATYHLVKFTGLSLKDWSILQPVVFAALSYFTLALAIYELTKGSRFAVVVAIILYTCIPAVADRGIIGFIEKEGVAITFIFLTIYFYSKLAKMINDQRVDLKKKILYAIYTAVSLAAIGWFWGGYVFILGSFIAFTILYPLFNSKAITNEYLLIHALIPILSIALQIVSPANLHTLGLYKPFNYRSIGVILIASLILPVIYAYLANYYRKIGLKKPLLNPVRYFFILVVIVAIGITLYASGVIRISARFAWALGLRAITPAPPLVQSIEEHQSPLTSISTISDMLVSWGTGLPAIYVIPLIFSPIILSIIGIVYCFYKGGLDYVFVGLTYLIGFYSYLNAAYMEAVASSLGIVVLSLFTAYILQSIIPSRREISDWRSRKVKAFKKTGFRLALLIIALILFANISIATSEMYSKHSRMVPMIMAGGGPIAARNDAWYRAIDVMKNMMPPDAVVVSWWDYGYWISVAGGKYSVADGATSNSTQIAILAKLLTSKNETELFQYMKMLRLPPDKTYLLVFDIFMFIRDSSDINKYYVYPYYQPYNLVGMVDIPKSIWMIRIGGRDIAEYLYLYEIRTPDGQTAIYISPRFDQPETLPLIYKVMVDGILSLSMFEANRTFVFKWYTGSMTELSYTYSRVRQELGIKWQISVSNIADITKRPFANNTYIQPFMIIAEPYPLQLSNPDASLINVVFIYKITYPVEQTTESSQQ